jgi:hypothetical protein
MTDERDPLPARDWQPVSSAWARKAAIDAAEAAIAASREKRKQSKEETTP